MLEWRTTTAWLQKKFASTNKLQGPENQVQ